MGGTEGTGLCAGGGSPSTAENDARNKAQEYLGIGVREYWRLDPEGTLMGTPLEGYRARGGRYQRVEPVERTDGVEHLRSGVLELDLRGGQRNGATVLVMRDPRTGKEFDGALEASERQCRIAEEDRASAAEYELTGAKEKLRDLKQQLRDLTGRTSRMGRDSQRRVSLAWQSLSATGPIRESAPEPLRLMSLASDPERTPGDPQGTRTWREADVGVTFRWLSVCPRRSETGPRKLSHRRPASLSTDSSPRVMRKAFAASQVSGAQSRVRHAPVSEFADLTLQELGPARTRFAEPQNTCQPDAGCLRMYNPSTPGHRAAHYHACNSIDSETFFGGAMGAHSIRRGRCPGHPGTPQCPVHLHR